MASASSVGDSGFLLRDEVIIFFHASGALVQRIPLGQSYWPDRTVAIRGGLAVSVTAFLGHSPIPASGSAWVASRELSVGNLWMPISIVHAFAGEAAATAFSEI